MLVAATATPPAVAALPPLVSPACLASVSCGVALQARGFDRYDGFADAGAVVFELQHESVAAFGA